MRSGLRLGGGGGGGGGGQGGWHYEDGLPNVLHPNVTNNTCVTCSVLHFRKTRQCDQFNRHGTQVPGTGQYPQV